MKRFLIVALVLAFPIASLTTAATKKKKPVCPTTLATCKTTGCGGDPNLNKQKNITTVPSGAAKDMTIADIKALEDPVEGVVKGGKRDMLATMGEGNLVRVVALALIVRPGSKESCNCGLGGVANTDNHIVLIDPDSSSPSLEADEPDSVTAEFTPRVRKRLPELSRANLLPLINDAPNNALRVRVTGTLLFDSEHSLGKHLKRHNNWEIHPVFLLEYCPADKTCPDKGHANWKMLGQ